MSDLQLKSSLAIEEIENNFKDTDFFSGIMDGLQEALAHKKGNAATDTMWQHGNAVVQDTLLLI